MIRGRSYHPGSGPTSALSAISATCRSGASFALWSVWERSTTEMRLMRLVRPAMVASVLAFATPVFAQTGGYGSTQSGSAVTTTDIQRLQDQVYDAGNEVSRLRSRDAALADRLQPQVDDLRDEVIYLQVKMRKEGIVSRSEYNDVRSRVDSIRSQTRAQSSSSSSNAQGSGNWSNGSNSGSGSGSGYGSGSSGSTGYGPPARRAAMPVSMAAPTIPRARPHRAVTRSRPARKSTSASSANSAPRRRRSRIVSSRPRWWISTRGTTC